MSEHTAVSFTRRTYRELVDGTLRVQVDIDPQFKDAFLRMFPEVDMRGAMTALVPEYQQLKAGRDGYQERAERPVGGWKQLGPLCQSAVQLCNDPLFQRYTTYMMQPEEGDSNLEEYASSYIKVFCGVESRKELDSDLTAAEMFKRLMASYRLWLEDHK